MKNEIIGNCPSCLNSKKGCANVDIYVSRNNLGEITNMYIFGDDHFDVPANNQCITEFSVSEDGSTITELVCPRCRERISVSIPVIENVKKQAHSSEYEEYCDLMAAQKYE